LGVFIKITLDESRLGPAAVRALSSVCPVDIFGLDGERLTVRAEAEDECTLCELCLNAAPIGALTIHKLYKNEQLVSRGGES
jgi:NAD-dependent dihydropyrimidine dehydrogenase PreA subunit